MRELLNISDTDVIKQGETAQDIVLSARTDSMPQIWQDGDTGTISIDTQDAFVKTIPVKLAIDSNNVSFSSSEISDLPAGTYQLELHATLADSGKTAVYPSDDYLVLTIKRSADSLNQASISTLTLDELKKQLKEDVNDAVAQAKLDPGQKVDLSDYAKKSDLKTITLDVPSRTLTIDNQAIVIPESVDLSKYATKDEVPNVTYDTQTKTLTIDGQQVKLPADIDLSDYAKKTDVKDITLDVNARTLTIAGQEIDIPSSVDLSDYAKKNEVPAVTYDVDTKTLTVDGQKVEIPANVDLSGYYTKAQIDGKLANIASGGKVDLTGYLTKADAETTYAKKTDIPNVDDFVTKEDADASYAKKSDVKDVDLTPYVTVTDMTQKLADYAKKSDLPDFSNFVTEDVADSTYAKKTDIPDVSDFVKQQVADFKYATKKDVKAISLNPSTRTLTIDGQIIDIPQQIDLSGYAKKTDIPAITYNADKHELTIDGQGLQIPESVDLSNYYTKADVDKKITDAVSGGKVDLSGYLKVVDADKTYAKKSDIPAPQDLSDYAKKSDVKPISLDTTDRTLTIDGQTLTIPDSVDLSGYAKKNEVPSVLYDASSKTLTINGQQVEIPDNVDMTGFLTKNEAYATYAKISDLPKVTYSPLNNSLSINGQQVALSTDLSKYLTSDDASKTYVTKDQLPKSVDLTGYLKIADADTTYAKKTDIPDTKNFLTQEDGDTRYEMRTEVEHIELDPVAHTIMKGRVVLHIPDSVDLSDYAKKDEVPNVVYNKYTNELTVNGQQVNIPASVDMTDFLKVADADAKYATKVELTGYISKADADSTYAKKSDIPTVKDITLDPTKRTLTVADQTINIPDSVDLSNYYDKSDVDQKIATAVSGGKVDLSGYLKIVDADAKYAKKSDVQHITIDPTNNVISEGSTMIHVPNSVDLRPYLQSAVAESLYAKKTDVSTVHLDTEKRVLTVNGQDISIPESIDLSGYAKSSDLSVYLKTADADSKYATKAETPRVELADMYHVGFEIPDGSGSYTALEASTDSGVKQIVSSMLVPTIKNLKSKIPAVIYDKDNNTLTINGQEIIIPASVDMSDFLKVADAEATYAKKTDMPQALQIDENTISLTVKNNTTGENETYRLPADDSIAKRISTYVDQSIQNVRGSIPMITWDQGSSTLTVNDNVIPIPKDLSQYLTEGLADTRYASKLDLEKAESTIPTISYDDSTHHLTINDKSYELSSGGTSGNIDLSDYLKSSDADAKYVKKADSPTFKKKFNVVEMTFPGETLITPLATSGFVTQKIAAGNRLVSDKIPKIAYNDSTGILSVNDQQIKIKPLRGAIFWQLAKHEDFPASGSYWTDLSGIDPSGANADIPQKGDVVIDPTTGQSAIISDVKIDASLSGAGGGTFSTYSATSGITVTTK